MGVEKNADRLYKEAKRVEERRRARSRPSRTPARTSKRSKSGARSGRPTTARTKPITTRPRTNRRTGSRCSPFRPGRPSAGTSSSAGSTPRTASSSSAAATPTTTRNSSRSTWTTVTCSSTRRPTAARSRCSRPPVPVSRPRRSKSRVSKNDGSTTFRRPRLLGLERREARRRRVHGRPRPGVENAGKRRVLEKGGFVVRGDRTYFEGTPAGVAVGITCDDETRVIGGPPAAIEGQAATSITVEPGQYAQNDTASASTAVPGAVCRPVVRPQGC